jgi:hypothetical protein
MDKRQTTARQAGKVPQLLQTERDAGRGPPFEPAINAAPKQIH